MRIRPLVIFSIAAFLIVSVVARGFQDNSRGPADKNSRPKVDFSHFPIVDLSSPEPSDAASRTRRASKSRKYNEKFQAKISDLTDLRFVVNEELGKLPALPVERSSVILVGDVVTAKAYLSEDKTSVYAEFEIRTQTIFKNKSKQTLNADDMIAIERFGGRVRLPSGKLFIATIDNQDMPRVGARYVLFLTNDFFGPKHSDEDFNLLMAYELTAGKVFL
jgi:hypothetical protein